MDKGMTLAIAVLQERREKLKEEYERDSAELDNAIVNLQKIAHHGKPEVKAGAFEPGRLQGMCLSDSIHALLLQTSPMPFKTIVEALRVGGVRMGDPQKPNRFPANVKTTIVNNRKRFKYDKQRDTVRLLLPALA